MLLSILAFDVCGHCSTLQRLLRGKSICLVKIPRRKYQKQLSSSKGLLHKSIVKTVIIAGIYRNTYLCHVND